MKNALQGSSTEVLGSLPMVEQSPLTTDLQKSFVSYRPVTNSLTPIKLRKPMLIIAAWVNRGDRQLFHLQKPICRIGRAEGCDLMLMDRTVSRFTVKLLGQTWLV